MSLQLSTNEVQLSPLLVHVRREHLKKKQPPAFELKLIIIFLLGIVHVAVSTYIIRIISTVTVLVIYVNEQSNQPAFQLNLIIKSQTISLFGIVHVAPVSMYIFRIVSTVSFLVLSVNEQNKKALMLCIPTMCIVVNDEMCDMALYL